MARFTDRRTVGLDVPIVSVPFGTPGLVPKFTDWFRGTIVLVSSLPFALPLARFTLPRDFVLGSVLDPVMMIRVASRQCRIARVDLLWKLMVSTYQLKFDSLPRSRIMEYQNRFHWEPAYNVSAYLLTFTFESGYSFRGGHRHAIVIRRLNRSLKLNFAISDVTVNRLVGNRSFIRNRKGLRSMRN